MHGVENDWSRKPDLSYENLGNLLKFYGVLTFKAFLQARAERQK
jgi:hypothetical protein